MTFLHMDVSAHQESSVRPPHRRILTTADVPMMVGSQMGEPSHHSSGEASCGGHDISAEWPSWSDDVLKWWKAVHESSPGWDRMTIAPPQSPTAVDCIHSVTEREQAEVVLKRECGGFNTLYNHSGAVETENDDRLHALLDALLADSMLEDMELDDSGPEDSVSVSEDAVTDDESMSDDLDYKELHRLRQRSYETKHKKKKQEELNCLRDRWFKIEIAFHRWVQTRALPLVVNRHATLQDRYLELLLEERGLQRDRILLETAWFWRNMFSFRNYAITEEELANGRIHEDGKKEDTKEGVLDKEPTDQKTIGANGSVTKLNYKQVADEIPEEILRTTKRWVNIDRQIFGDATVRPFQPLYFEFEWQSTALQPLFN